jgi:hypothetical protein
MVAITEPYMANGLEEQEQEEEEENHNSSKTPNLTCGSQAQLLERTIPQLHK